MTSGSMIALGAAMLGVLLHRWGVSRVSKPGGVLDGQPSMELAAMIARVLGPALAIVGVVAAAVAHFLAK